MCQRPNFDRPKKASSRPVLGATVCALLLALGLPTCVAFGVLPDPAVGWAAKPSTAAVATAAIVLFGALCIVERGARFVLDHFLATHELLGNPEYRRILARHAMDTAALCYISYLGLSMCSELDWTKLPETPHARLYLYMPRFAWACVAMLAFQVACAACTTPPACRRGDCSHRSHTALLLAPFQSKNLLDTLTYHDGPEFIAHHVVCILVALGSLEGSFLHLCAPAAAAQNARAPAPHALDSASNARTLSHE